MNNPKFEEVLAALVKTVGKHPHDKVSAVEALTKALTDCRETVELVREAMQPWVDNHDFSSEDTPEEDD